MRRLAVLVLMSLSLANDSVVVESPITQLAQTEKKSGNKPTTKPASKGAASKGKARMDAAAARSEVVAKHLAFLLKEVPEIKTPGIPGPLCVYGPQAFPIVVAKDKGREAPLVAGAELGQGRLIAWPHNGYFGNLLVEHPATGKLMSNCLTWLGGKESTAEGDLKVAVRGYDTFREQFKQRGVLVTELPNQGWTSKLTEADVVVADLADCQPDDVTALVAYVKAGGGLMASNLIWAWKQSHADLDPATDHPSNQVYSQAGIVWTDGYSPKNDGQLVATSLTPSELSHVGQAIEALDMATNKERSLSADELSTIRAVVSNSYSSIPPNEDAGVRSRLKGYIDKYAKQTPIPSEKNPIKPSQADVRLVVAIQTEVFNSLPVAELKAHPAAATFPGTVTAAVKRVTRKLTLDLSHAGWKSTGLYAPAGGKLTVKTDAESAQRGFSVRIGCHQDSLMEKDAAWVRVPEMVRRFSLNKPVLEMGHALGGPIYLDVPEKDASGTITIEFANVIDAPYYVHGTTDRSDWVSGIRNHPAPWAELETRNIVLSVPSELIRKLDFPEKLMDHWAQAVDLCADLATIPRERKTLQRIVFDVQIGAGFMHSGYPIMAMVKPSSPEAVSLDHLQSQGAWGFYHELGHNHQQGDWTFEGTVEVTCNLFSLYVHEKLTPRSKTHEAVAPDFKAKAEQTYVAEGAKFEKWQADPFLALIMYQQLREAFGWETYQKVFEEYRKLPDSERPKNEQEKRDQWMVRFSRTAGKNLGPFFQYWGIPTSAAARQSISNLPSWMPVGKR